MLKKLAIVLGVLLLVCVVFGEIYYRRINSELRDDPRVALMVEASAYLVKRATTGTLPGIAADEHGDLRPTQDLAPHGSAPSYPYDVVIDLDKQTGTDHHLRYTLRKPAADTPWTLARAERLNADGTAEPLPDVPAPAASP